MSISDNEEYDTKPPARRPTDDAADSNKKKKHSDDGASSSQHVVGSSSEQRRLQRHVLTFEEQRDVSYQRTASLLFSSSDDALRNNSRRNSLANIHREDDEDVEIAVIPSLVSLSDDFFHPPSTIETSTTAAAAASSSGAVNNVNDERSSLSTARTAFPDFSSTHSTSSSTFTSNTLTANQATNNATQRIQNLPTLRPRINNAPNPRGVYSILTGSGLSVGSSSNNNNNSPPPETWPVGPQGAPIPSHLLLVADQTVVNDGNNESSSARENEVERRRRTNNNNDGRRMADGAALTDAAASINPPRSPQPSFSSDLNTDMLNNPPLSAPSNLFGRTAQVASGTNVASSANNSPSRLYDGGVRRERHNAAAAAGRLLPRQPQQQQQQQQQQPVYINAVHSLDHAVKRLESKLKARKEASAAAAAAGSTTSSSTTSPARSRTRSSSLGSQVAPPSANQQGAGGGEKTMEELELKTLTQLAEIMLHPPTSRIGNTNTYCWDDDNEDGDGAKEEEEKSSCPPSDKVVQKNGQDNMNGDDDDGMSDGDGDDESIDIIEETTILHTTSSSSIHKSPSSTTITTNNKKCRYPTIQSIQSSISTLGNSIPCRRVCQYPFKRNDIVWVCRTCQSDETCVLCHECFTNSNHEGHDVAFYHAQAGGCCDCGDADAWSPSGFCKKHGMNDDSIKIGVEPGVLGSVHAISDYLVKVVQKSVEEGYKRANPLLFVNKNNNAHGTTLLEKGNSNNNNKKKFPAIGSRSDSLLPEYYEEQDGGRQRRERRSIQRHHSLERRNTVADIETTATTEGGRVPSSASLSLTGSFGDQEGNEDVDAMSTTTPLPDDNNGDNDDVGMTMTTRSRSRSNSSNALPQSHPPTPIFHHEVQFDPTAASTSRKWHKRSESSMSLDENNDNVFNPEAASSPTRHRAAKKPRAPPSYPEIKTPARTLGDLGREEQGLFLVLHCDDIHMGNSSSRDNHAKLISALKELYSAPGGGGSGGDAATSNATTTGPGSSSVGLGGTLGAAATNTFIDRPNPRGLQQRHRLMLHPTRHSLFRAPHAEAILDRIVRVVKKQGNLIVWGTQEILAECGDVTARCWRDGDPNSSTLVGAAMLNRAKILTNHGLVCSIKTRQELRHEQKSTTILNLVGWLASSCDQICDQISLGMSSNALVPLLRNDLKLSNQFVEAWHSLLLTLLAVPDFKAAMANAYCDTYRA